MKPDWDKLMAEYADNNKILIADVDCTAEGKPLCDSNGIKGFPTIKHGDANSLEDYQGGRDYASLSKFASELKPVCSPVNIDLCDEEGKAAIEKFQAMDDAALEAEIKAGEDKMQEAEDTFKSEVEKLQQKYQELMTERDDTLKEIKESGLGMAKAVKATKK